LRIIVGEAPDDNSQSTVSDIAWNRAKQMLKESDWAVLPDVPMTAGVKAEWIEYRRALREVRLQNGFPTNINWPTKPQ
jgi:hypothetical protein